MLRENEHDVAGKQKDNSVGAHLCLNGSRSLGAQHLDGLENVHHPLVPHPLQHDAEGDENTGPPYSSTVGGQMETYLEPDIFGTVKPVVMHNRPKCHVHNPIYCSSDVIQINTTVITCTYG